MTGADLLRRSPIDLGTLASRLGYGSEDAFSRTFKRHYGLTPREFRKALASQDAVAS
jgi:AraC-like DNA-binding protein